MQVTNPDHFSVRLFHAEANVEILVIANSIVLETAGCSAYRQVNPPCVCCGRRTR
jgi:hypothetical protein